MILNADLNTKYKVKLMLLPSVASAHLEYSDLNTGGY